MLAEKVLAVLTLTVAAMANPMEKRNGCDVNHPVQACCDGFLNCIVGKFISLLQISYSLAVVYSWWDLRTAECLLRAKWRWHPQLLRRPLA
jgi:hypothetical protein